MPTFRFTSPEGKTYDVNGPDGATHEQAFQMLQSQLGGTKQEPDLGSELISKVGNTYLGRAASNLPAGLETSGRMLAGLPAYLGGAIAGSVGEAFQPGAGKAIQEAVSASPLTNPAKLIPQSGRSKQMEEMISAGSEKFLGGAQDVGRTLAAGQLGPEGLTIDPAREEIGNIIGDVGGQAALNLAPIPGAKLVGKALKGKPVKSPFDAIRENIPEVKGMTDAQIIEWSAAQDRLSRQRALDEVTAQNVDTQNVRNPYGVEANRLAVDENGIPVRQKVSDELAMTQGAEARQAPMQRVEAEAAVQRGEPLHGSITPADIQKLQEPLNLSDPNAIHGPDPVPEAFKGGPREGVVDFENVPVDKSLLALQDNAGRGPDIPYSNPLSDHVNQRLANVPERLQADPVVQRLTKQAQILQGMMKSLIDNAGKSLVEGAGTRSGKVDIAKGHAAEAKRLQTEHAYMSQQLDNVLSQLDNRVRSANSGLKKQRGVIDPDLLTFGVSTLIRKLGNRKTLSKFEGTFNKDILARAIREAQAKRGTSMLVWMDPQDFHSLARKRSSETIANEDKRASVRKGLDTTEGLHDMPILVVDKIGDTWQVVGHEGRHRMDVFKEQGMDKVPVLVRREFHRNQSVATGWPDWVLNEDGRHSYAFPEPMELGGPLGQTKVGAGQRGSIGVKPETPFQTFEKSLPEPMKPFAKSLWEKMEAGKKNPSFEVNPEKKTIAKVLNKVVGGLELYVPNLKPWGKEVKAKMVDTPDMGKSRVGDLFVGGANLKAAITKDPRVKYVSDNVRYSMEAKRRALAVKLHGPDGIITTWQKLSKNEQLALAKVRDKYEGVKWLSDEELRAEGMNERQAAAYNAGRKHFTDTFNDLQADRIASKEAPLKERPGYWPASWSGDYHFEVRKRHSDGRLELVRLETGNWKGIAGRGGLSKVREKFIAEFGDKYEVGPIEQRARRGATKETQTLYDQLVRKIGEDHPDKAALDRIFEAYNEEIADSTRNFREHMKIKTGVEGYRGNKLDVSDYENVKGALYSAEGYIKDAHDYLETKKAARNVNGMLFDRDLRAQAPNALKYAEDYWNHARGVESMLSRVINTLVEVPAESVGLSRYTHKEVTRRLKNGMMQFILGFNRPVFILAQRVQSLQFTLPALYKIKADLGMEKWTETVGEAAAKGYHDSAMYSIHKDSMSPLGKEAMKYALESHMVDQVFIDDIHTSTSGKAAEMIKYINGTKSLTWADRASRIDSYLQFVHLLDKTGLKGKDLFMAASDAMKRAMVDYVPEERPMIYSHFGFVGDLASPLTTFVHNYYSQLYMYGKEALKNHSAPYARPLMAFLLTQYMMAGYMGTPLRQDFDFIIDMARANGLLPPTTKNVTQMLASTSDTLQEGTKNTIRYGVIAGVTGMDISPTVGAGGIIPDHGVGGRFPVVGKAAEIVGNVANVAGREAGRLLGGQGSNVVDRAALLKAATPPAGQFAVEAINQDPTSGMIPDPNKNMVGTFQRGPFSAKDPNWQARMLGTRSIKESEEATAKFQSTLQEDAIKKREVVLLSEMKNLRTGGKDFSKLMEEYVSYGHSPNDVWNAIQENIIQQNQTGIERAKGIPKSLGGAKKYERASEYR